MFTYFNNQQIMIKLPLTDTIFYNSELFYLGLTIQMCLKTLTAFINTLAILAFTCCCNNMIKLCDT